jgi:hypothetical protein
MALSLEAITANVRKTPEGLVSVYDVIAVVKGCTVSNAGTVYRRLLEEERVPMFPRFRFILDVGTTNGGNKLSTPVTDARGLVQLIWALPGKSDFRRQCADVCVRYIGGDTSLVEEIFQNRLAQETLAREQPDHPARLFGEAVESEAIKRKREDLVHAQLDLEIEEALVSRKRLRITHMVESYQLAGIPLDDRARLQLRDLVGSATSTVEPREICVREFLLSKGVNKRYESAFGRAVADLKRAELRAAGQPETLLKKRIECNGQIISANLYLEDDLPLFEAAFVSKHFQDASVSVRENGKKVRRT